MYKTHQREEEDANAATVPFLDTGHFALETHVDEIAFAMRRFLASGISLT